MSSADYDVIIVGAGPAGATCAWFAARAGLRVLLIDAARFPRDKACGDAITSSKALPLLHAMGLGKELHALAPTRCPGAWISSNGGAKVRLAPPDDSALAVEPSIIWKRRDFDTWLLGHVRDKATVWEGLRVTGLLRTSGRIEGIMAREQATGDRYMLRASVVIGADGAHSRVAHEAGLLPLSREHLSVALRGYFRGLSPAPEQAEVYYLEGLAPGYLWIFPCGDGYANVGLGVLHRQLGSLPEGLTEHFWHVLTRHSMLRDRFRTATLMGNLQGWPLTNWSGWQPRSGHGVLLVGDAAWLVDPLTGEGIGNAMLSGRLAADTIADTLAAGAPSAMRLRRYDHRLRHALGRELRDKQLICRLLHSERLTQGLLRVLGSRPCFSRALSALACRPQGHRQGLFCLEQIRRAVRSVFDSDADGRATIAVRGCSR